MRKNPDHTRQLDFFIAYLVDLPWRDQRESMERPFFSLAKSQRLTPIEYLSRDGKVWVKVFAHQDFGMATIWDADIIIWAISQVVELINRGQQPSRTIQFHPYDLLKAIGRSPKGKTQYDRLRAALDRLHNTTVKTNIRWGDIGERASFHWLDSWQEVVDEHTKQCKGMQITLPDWIYKGILKHSGVLAIHEDYFLLTGGLERWLYKVARKHAGMQDGGLFISLPILYEKSGVESRYRQFKYDLQKIVQRDELPEYHLEWIEKTMGVEPAVHMIRRSKLDPSEPGFEAEGKRGRNAPRLKD